MKKKQLKESFLDLINESIEDLSLEEKVKLIKGYLFEVEKKQEYKEVNKGNEWTDEELKVIFSLTPSKENCLKLAKAFGRGYGSIEQIYRWAATSDKDITNSPQSENKFISQIKRISKECGWRV